ncbi:MAG: MerR family transcriptional regulator, partial [Lachnospiraceae bacterium]|nr:MerR family transcriptional regulator [Lachnospiraceae bacterium]
MGYKVKWVEDHLGITRKALRTYEEKGVMPRNKYGQYRNYSEEDIYRIWTIKVLQGIGYSLKEIANIEKVDDFNPDASIAEKIKDLEKEQARIEQVLGYARTIKLTGRLPSWPKEMGSMKFEDFYKKSLNEWNINDDPASQAYQSLADSVLNKS